MLKKHAEENPSEQDKCLTIVLFTYRTRVNTTTGSTPFELIFGRTMNEFDDFSLTQDPITVRLFEIKKIVEGTHSKVLKKNRKTS